MGPILCTQPRRFAVVAVARMVAKARNCEVGGEVGYHIGHSKVFSARYLYNFAFKYLYFFNFFYMRFFNLQAILIKDTIEDS